MPPSARLCLGTALSGLAAIPHCGLVPPGRFSCLCGGVVWAQPFPPGWEDEARKYNLLTLISLWPPVRDRKSVV